MIIIIYIYILYLRVIGAFETSIIKFPGYVFYIYLGVIVVNLLVKLILLGIAEIDIVPDLCGSNCSSHSNSPEIYDNKIILKISNHSRRFKMTLVRYILEAYFCHASS